MFDTSHPFVLVDKIINSNPNELAVNTDTLSDLTAKSTPGELLSPMYGISELANILHRKSLVFDNYLNANLLASKPSSVETTGNFLDHLSPQPEYDNDCLLGIKTSSTVASLPTITISASDATAAETVSGQTTNPGRFTLTRTGNTTSSLTVNYTISGTATNGVDYNNLNGSVTFAVGAATATINLNPIDDTLLEGNESIILTLAPSSNYNIGTSNRATVTIADNDIPTITIAATDANAGETVIGVPPNPGRFTLTRTGNLTNALTVNYTIGGTATNSVDYSNLTGNVTFAAGSSTAIIDINSTDDTVFEGNETVILTLASSSNYNIGASNRATVTIADNDLPTITIAATDGNASETASGQPSNPGRFTLTRTGNTASALTVNYTITGTATNGVDYTNLTGTVTFAAGSSTAIIDINTINDTLVENNETVILTLAGGSNYNIGANNKATVTIVDNDTVPGTVQLVRQFGTSQVDFGIGIATDQNGNTYIAGRSWVTVNNVQSFDSWISKRDAAGNEIWTRVIRKDDVSVIYNNQIYFGYNNDLVNNIVVDRTGNIYIGGTSQFFGFIHYGNDPNNPVDDTSRPLQDSNAWLIKFDSAGNQLWADEYDYSLEDIAWDLAVDANGNAYLAGYTSNSTTTFENGGAFLMKYTSSGTRSWTQRLGSNATDAIKELTTDSAGNVYIVGESYGLNGFSGSDVWAGKYDTNGNLQWLQAIVTSGLTDEGTGIGVDGNGNVYISGRSTDNLNQQQNPWVIKLDTNGNRDNLWRFSQTNTNQLMYAYQDLVVDATGNVYLSGFKATATGTNSILGQALLLKVNSTGEILWEQAIGGADGTTIAENITLGSDGRIYLVGWTRGALGGTNQGYEDAWYGVFSN